MTVQNIKREIEMLSPGEVSELQAWLNEQELDEATVDMQLKSAVDSGRFDSLIDEAIEDEKAGLTTSL
jgi:DNA replication protein DnaD